VSRGAVTLQRRVLLVDDDPLLLDVLTTVLDLEEFEVLAASDGDTALDLATRVRIDLVVCDVRMPGTDGLEVCRRLKTDPSTADVPVILLTGRDTEGSRAAGEAAGCDAYVTKPFSALELLDVMRAQPPREPRPSSEE
jgi:DNA-binding response OmpR family regulator